MSILEQDLENLTGIPAIFKFLYQIGPAKNKRKFGDDLEMQYDLISADEKEEIGRLTVEGVEVHTSSGYADYDPRFRDGTFLGLTYVGNGNSWKNCGGNHLFPFAELLSKGGGILVEKFRLHQKFSQQLQYRLFAAIFDIQPHQLRAEKGGKG